MTKGGSRDIGTVARLRVPEYWKYEGETMSHTGFACAAMAAILAIGLYCIWTGPAKLLALAPGLAKQAKWQEFIAMFFYFALSSVAATVGLAIVFSWGQQGMLAGTPAGKLALMHGLWCMPSAFLYAFVFVATGERYRLVIRYLAVISMVLIVALSLVAGDFSMWAAVIAQAVFGWVPLSVMATAELKFYVGTSQEIVFGQAAISAKAATACGVMGIALIWMHERAAGGASRERG